jgi:hypothetical protein
VINKKAEKRITISELEVTHPKLYAVFTRLQEASQIPSLMCEVIAQGVSDDNLTNEQLFDLLLIFYGSARTMKDRFDFLSGKFKEIADTLHEDIKQMGAEVQDTRLERTKQAEETH